MLAAVLVALVYRFPKTTGAEPDRSGEIVLAVINEDQETEYLDQPESEFQQLSQHQPPVSPSSIATDTPPTVEFPVKDNNLFPGPPPLTSVPTASALANESTASTPETPYELSEEDLELIAADQKLVNRRRPKGSKTSISIFGTGQLTGRNFVFLIDRSQSMGEQGLGVLQQARAELTQAIAGLQDNHSFQIVVYNNSSATIGRRRLLPATEENKNKVPEFMQNLLAFGGTDHERGLYSAMAFSPDIIVMMTDGGSPDLHDGTIKAIRRTAGSTQIHTIQFGLGPAQAGDHFLKKLSNRTAGTYRYVNVRDWRKQK